MVALLLLHLQVLLFELVLAVSFEAGDEVLVPAFAGLGVAFLLHELLGEGLDADIFLEQLFRQARDLLLHEMRVFLHVRQYANGPRFLKFLLVLGLLDLLVLVHLQRQQLAAQHVVLGDQVLQTC